MCRWWGWGSAWTLLLSALALVRALAPALALARVLVLAPAWELVLVLVLGVGWMLTGVAVRLS